MKQNRLVCGLGTVLTIQQALISKFAFRAGKVIGTFETRAPQTRKYKRKPKQKPRIGSSERQI